MIELPILEIQVFFDRVDQAINKVLTELRNSDLAGKEYGGQFFVKLSSKENIENKEQNPFYIAYNLDELRQQFKRYCNIKLNNYDDIYFKKATLIDPSLNCTQICLEESGIVIALPYIKLMKRGSDIINK